MGRAIAAASLSLAVVAGPVSAAPAHGLIVKLKDAPAHEQALAHTAVAAAEGARWQRMLAVAGIAPSERRPVGTSAQLLDFGRVLREAEAESLAQALRARPEVEWVAPNVRERRLQDASPNDPLFIDNRGTEFGQWWLYRATGSNQNAIEDRLRGVPGFRDAWVTENGSAPIVRVAVLDTGYTAHPELTGRLLPGYDFVSEVAFANDGNGRDADARDPGDWVSAADLADPAFGGCAEENSSWHGTIIAGQIAALTDNAAGVAAMNWNARVLPVRVAGKCGATVVDIVDGMRWAAGLLVSGVPRNANPARIVNISFGGSGDCTPYQDAINDLRAAGVVVVAAAGNDSSATPTRPAKCPGVVGVVALNRDGFKSSYSNFGSTATIATVGGDPPETGSWGGFVGDSGLLGIDNRGTRGPGTHGYSYLSGTSFAAPLAAGVLSLMLAADPTQSATQLVQRLRTSARPHVTSPVIGACSASNPGRCECTTSTCGAGILDATRALQAARGQTPGPLTPAIIDNAEVRAAAATGPDVPDAPPVEPPDDSNRSGGGAVDAAALAALLLSLLLLAPRRR